MKTALVVLICVVSRRLCKVTTRAQEAHKTENGLVAQLVSAPPCHGGGRGFKSRQGRIYFGRTSCPAVFAFRGTSSIAVVEAAVVGAEFDPPVLPCFSCING